MMKKLFLFTLLVSSFLVISCSNEDTTGATEEKPIGTGIDAKYAYTYEGTEANPNDHNQSITMILIVDSNGGGSLEIKSTIPEITSDKKNFTSSQIDKYSDTKYKFQDGSFEFNFSNDGSTVDVISGGASLLTLNKKQQ